MTEHDRQTVGLLHLDNRYYGIGPTVKLHSISKKLSVVIFRGQSTLRVKFCKVERDFKFKKGYLHHLVLGKIKIVDQELAAVVRSLIE